MTLQPENPNASLERDPDERPGLFRFARARANLTARQPGRLEEVRGDALRVVRDAVQARGQVGEQQFQGSLASSRIALQREARDGALQDELGRELPL